MNCITLYCACTDMPAAAPSDLKCSTSCSAVHFSASYGFCGVVPKLEGGECCWGNSFSTDSICFNPSQLHRFHNSAKRHPNCFRERQRRCLRMVGDGCGRCLWHPGKLPTSWKAPSPAVAGARDAPTPTMRQTVGGRQRWFSEFRTFPALLWITTDGAQYCETVRNDFCGNLKTSKKWGKQRWSESDIWYSSKESQPSLHCPR